MVDGSRGYVKVVNENGKYTYYVSYSTTNFGLKEVSKDELSPEYVEKGYVVNKPSGIMCTID